MERIRGNKRTELADANGKLITENAGTPSANGRPIADPNGKPVNQTGYGFGPGLDYNFHSRACLNLRYRRFTYSDKNFTFDKFKGGEITTEFKVFF
jgi:opacity protein-like surface antigen